MLVPDTSGFPEFRQEFRLNHIAKQQHAGRNIRNNFISKMYATFGCSKGSKITPFRLFPVL